MSAEPARVVDFATARARLRPGTEPWVDKRTVAEHCGVCTRTITNWMARGMPYSRRFENSPARFRLSDVDRWMEGGAA